MSAPDECLSVTPPPPPPPTRPAARRSPPAQSLGHCSGADSESDAQLESCLLLQNPGGFLFITYFKVTCEGGGGWWRTCAMRYDEPRLVCVD